MADASGEARSRSPKSHLEAARAVASMVGDRAVRRLAAERGMHMVNVMWEDTGRFLGSSVGPNISDVSIEVEAEAKSGHKRRLVMPVLRFPNFTDKTGDVDIDRFFIRVGNHRKGGGLETVSLREFLERPTRYMSMPEAGRIRGGSLLAPRDEKVLTSAQAAFLPIRTDGKTRFWPVIFNYQSYREHPAVLTLLVTRQGTSMTIIDNERDSVAAAGGSWGQRLYFNAGGERAPLIAERESDVRRKGVTANGERAETVGDDGNMMLLIQIPLKQRRRRAMGFGAGGLPAAEAAPMMSGAMSDEADRVTRRGRDDIETAVIGHGPSEGPYTELDELTVARDPRFPVRVTVQFYQATSNGVATESSIERLAARIGRVYDEADYVGSLVIPNGARRATMWTGVTVAPLGLTWRDFPGLLARWAARGGGAGAAHLQRVHSSLPRLYAD